MALDLFKRVDSRKGLFAVEKITLIYSLLTTILILFLWQSMDHPLGMIRDRVLIAAMTFVLMYLYRLAPCKFSAFVRIAVQMSLLSYWYPDTFEFNRLFPNLDHIFASAEQWIFGSQPALWLCQAFPQIWVSEPMNMGYFSYYPMILAVMVYYFLFRFELFEKVSFVVVAAFLSTILSTFLFLWRGLSSTFRLLAWIMCWQVIFRLSVTTLIITTNFYRDRIFSRDFSIT